MNITKVISTLIDDAGRRIIKILNNGRSDAQTSNVAAPYGVDSNPIKDLIAVYSPTQQKGVTVIIGYINRNAIAAIGEHRIFSTDTDGVVVTSIHLKNDGTMEVGGDGDNMVRFTKLNLGLINQDADINVELGKIAAGLNAIVPGSYTPTFINTDIDDAKIDEIKTLS